MSEPGFEPQRATVPAELLQASEAVQGTQTPNTLQTAAPGSYEGQVLTKNTEPAPGEVPHRPSRSSFPRTAPSQVPDKEPRDGRRQDPIQSFVSIVSCLMCLLIIGVVIAKAVAALPTGGVGEEDICHHFDCMQFGKLLNASVDTTEDPCNNFYRFVCNGWDRDHDQSVLTQHYRDYIKLVGQKAMSLPIPTKSQSAMEKAARYYQSCAELVYKNRTEVEQFKAMLLHGNITWPKKQEGAYFLEAMAYAETNWDSSPIFTFERIVQPNGSIAVQIMPSTFISVWNNVRKAVIEKGQYDKYYAITYALLGDNVLSERALNDSKTIERKVVKNLLNSVYVRNATPLAEDGFKKISVAFEYGRWRKLFFEVLGIPMQEPITISLVSIDFFAELNRMTQAETEGSMTLFLGWGVIYQVGRLFMPDITALIYDTVEAGRDAALRNCLHHVNQYMGIAISMPYTSQAVPQTAYDDVTAMYKNLTSVIEKELTKLRFDYPEYQRTKTPVAMFGKFGKIKRPSQLDAQYADYPDMGASFSMNMRTTIRAWRASTDRGASDRYRQDYSRLYDAALQDVVIQPIAMTVPVYSMTVPLAVRYGALGSLMLAGIMEDLYANVVPQMELNSRDKFVGAKACIRKAQPGPLSVLDETIYASAAGKVLTQAYYNALPIRDGKGHKAEKPSRLQYLPKYGGEQLMFIAACYLTCSGSSDPYEGCNMPMRNLKHFSLAFRCSASSHMNLNVKCSAFDSI